LTRSPRPRPGRAADGAGRGGRDFGAAWAAGGATFGAWGAWWRRCRSRSGLALLGGLALPLELAELPEQRVAGLEERHEGFLPRLWRVGGPVDHGDPALFLDPLDRVEQLVGKKGLEGVTPRNGKSGVWDREIDG
jgi:hypothetical protein